MHKAETKNRTTSDLTRHLIEVFGQTDQKRKALLKGTEITAAQLSGRTNFIAAKAQRALLENIARLVGPGWVFRYHKDLDLRFSDELSAAMLHAPNLGDAFDLMSKFGHLREPAIYFEQFKFDGQRHVMFDLVYNATSKNRTVLDVISVSSYQFLEQIWAPSWRGVEVQFPFKKPDNSQLISNLYACPVSYGHKRYAYVFTEDICSRANPRADGNAYNRAVLNLFGQASVMGEANEFVQTIKNHLGSISSHRPNAEETASALRVSRRTLNRRLKQAGTSYRGLLDQSLKSRANKLLTETRLPHREIAVRLGYSDQTSFSRALKRWKHQDGSLET